MSHFYPGINPIELPTYPLWLLEALFENLAPLQAKEELRLAEIIGTFTRQADKKTIGKLRSSWRKFSRKRKNIISRVIAEPKKKAERVKIDFNEMSEAEKQEYNRWLEAQGIRNG